MNPFPPLDQRPIHKAYLRFGARLLRFFKQFRWSGLGGQSGTSRSATRRSSMLSWWLPGTRHDYVAKAGDLWKNSTVGICLDWIQLSFPEAQACIKVEKPDGSEEIVVGHPLSNLIRRPNPNYGSRALWGGTLLSYLVDGNAYWRKVRNNGGQVAQLHYVPHFQIEPRWPDDGSVFISHYEYYVDGTWMPLPKEDVVHFRYGIDPDNQRKGLAPLKTQLREVFTDNETSTYCAALLENLGILGLVISGSDSDTELDPEEGERIKKVIQARTTGDERGKPIIFPTSVKVDRLGFSPEEMYLSKLRQFGPERICPILVGDPLAVGLPSSNRGSYDNTEAAQRGAWENKILPMMAMLCDDLDTQLLRIWVANAWVAEQIAGATPFRQGSGSNAEAEYCGFDTRRVRALQEDRSQLIKDVIAACGGSVWTPNEGRAQMNYDPLPDPKYDVLREKAPPPFGQSGDGSDGGQKPPQKSLKALTNGHGGSAWVERILEEIAALNDGVLE